MPSFQGRKTYLLWLLILFLVTYLLTPSSNVHTILCHCIHIAYVFACYNHRSFCVLLQFLCDRWTQKGRYGFPILLEVSSQANVILCWRPKSILTAWCCHFLFYNLYDVFRVICSFFFCHTYFDFVWRFYHLQYACCSTYMSWKI